MSPKNTIIMNVFKKIYFTKNCPNKLKTMHYKNVVPHGVVKNKYKLSLSTY